MSNRYTKPLTYSLLLHAGMAVVLLVSVDFSSEPKEKPKPNAEPVIQAVAVNESALKEQVKKIKDKQDAQKRAEEKRVADLEKRAKAAQSKSNTEKKRIQQLEKDRKKKEAEKKAADTAARKAKDKQKTEQDKAKKAENIRKQKEAEKKQAEKAAADAKAKRLKEEEIAKKAAADKKRKEQEAIERAAEERAMQQQLEREQATRRQARRQQVMGEVGKYQALITQTIQRNMLIDESMRNKQCVLVVKLASSGFVTKVNVESGDRIVCEAAEKAVYKAGTLPVSKNPEIFAEMSSLRITVEPGFND